VNTKSSERELESAASLSQRLGLSFSNLSVLTRALTHRSYANENASTTEDNERLEFLGDAVLDFIVGEWAYHRFPEMAEGDLTRVRSSLVRNERLAEFARHLDLGPALRLGRGERSSGGHQRDNLLGSAFEALIGAVYLDCGLDEVKRFMDPILEWTRESVLDELHDPKSDLQERTQSHKLGTPQYHVVNTSKSHAERAAAQNALKNLQP
jgi:ribonuclease-3